MSRKKFKTKRERIAAIKNFERAERVKQMRSITGDTFSAKNGFDLRSPDKWTPAQKRKVTKYYQTLAPFVADTEETKVIKRYRNKDRLDAAIMETGQEKLLPGQTGAVFRAPRGQKLEVTFGRKAAVPSVKIGGAGVDTMRFNKARFIEDPEAEIERVLGTSDAKFFRLLVGANKGNQILDRGEVINELMTRINNYKKKKDKTPADFLRGLVAYTGIQRRSLQKQIDISQEKTRERRLDYYKEKSRVRRAQSPGELKTGRRGRVK